MQWSNKLLDTFGLLPPTWPACVKDRDLTRFEVEQLARNGGWIWTHGLLRAKLIYQQPLATSKIYRIIVGVTSYHLLAVLAIDYSGLNTDMVTWGWIPHFLIFAFNKPENIYEWSSRQRTSR